MQHRIPTDMEESMFKATGRAFLTPSGYLFGWGTTVGNGVENWAPGAIFIDLDAAADSQHLVNEGTATTASWTTFANLGA